MENVSGAWTAVTAWASTPARSFGIPSFGQIHVHPCSGWRASKAKCWLVLVSSKGGFCSWARSQAEPCFSYPHVFTVRSPLHGPCNDAGICGQATNEISRKQDGRNQGTKELRKQNGWMDGWLGSLRQELVQRLETKRPERKAKAAQMQSKASAKKSRTYPYRLCRNTIRRKCSI